MKKHTTAQLVFAASALVCQQVGAIGFGRVSSDAVLGQNLSVTVPVHVDAGERFGADCVSVEIYFGESRLLPSQVRTLVESAGSDANWRVLISTAAAIDEPVVEVDLNAGCERRFLRRFTVFANPATVSVAALPALSGAAPVSGAATPLAPQRAQASGAVPGTGTGGRAAHSRKGRGGPAAGSRLPLLHAPAPRSALVQELNGAQARTASRHAPAAAAAHPAAPALPGSRLVLEPGAPRLKLDMEDPVFPPPGAAIAPIGENDTDPTVRQLHALEHSIQAARLSEKAGRDQAAKLQSQLAAAQSRSEWLPYVLGLLALAVALVAALAWKLRRQSRLHAHSVWFESQLAGREPGLRAAGGAPMPETPSQLDAPVSIGGEVVSIPPVLDDTLPPEPRDPREAPDADPTATRPLDRAMLAGLMGRAPAPPEPAPRELSVEELLDLEQQADFFIALGQEDAAVDLLMSHLRSAGGQSPLPYTKLLEIYKRQGDRTAYERTRARFNRRFNAYAPDWDAGPGSGRTLEDYAETVERLQAVWPTPIDAMAFLESMLFKRDETSELFDLPAYRDVLLMYSLARDLWQHGGGDGGTPVDVLLPLDDAPARTPAQAINGLDLPLEGASRRRADPPDFQVTGMASAIDLEIPHLDLDGPDDLPPPPAPDAGAAVHATLDALGLVPREATKASASGRGQDAPAGDDGEPPPRH
jgi:hypothetical protein